MPTILIIEDEYAVARGVQYALQQEGYEVTLAPNAEEGLDIATELAPEVLRELVRERRDAHLTVEVLTRAQ